MQLCEHLATSGFSMLGDRVYGFFTRFNCEACNSIGDPLLTGEAYQLLIDSHLLILCEEVGCGRYYFVDHVHTHLFTCFKCDCLYEEEDKALHTNCYVLCPHLAEAGFGLHGLARPRAFGRELCCTECHKDTPMLKSEVSDVVLFCNPPVDGGDCPDCECFVGSDPHTCKFWCSCHKIYYNIEEEEVHMACYTMCSHLESVGFGRSDLPRHVGRTLLCAKCLSAHESEGMVVPLQVFLDGMQFRPCPKCYWFCCKEAPHQCRRWCKFHRCHFPASDSSHAKCGTCKHCKSPIYENETHCVPCERCLEYHTRDTVCTKCDDCGYSHHTKGCESFHDSFGLKGAIPDVIRHEEKKLQAYFASKKNCELIYPGTPLFVTYDVCFVCLVEMHLAEGTEIIPVSFVFRVEKDKSIGLAVSAAFHCFRKEVLLCSALSISCVNNVRHQRARKQFVSEQTTQLTIGYRNRSSIYGLGNAHLCHFTLGPVYKAKDLCGFEMEGGSNQCIRFAYKGLCYECALSPSQPPLIINYVPEVKALRNVTCVTCRKSYATFEEYFESSCTPNFSPDAVIVYTINMKRISEPMFVLHALEIE